jgi:hypothetical protein
MTKKTLRLLLVSSLVLSVYFTFDNNHTADAQSAPVTATLALSPTSNSVGVSQNFTVTVNLNTGGSPVNAVDIYRLRFNPSLLQVVDSDAGASGVQISPGSVLPNTVNNTVDNTAGTIQFAQDAGGGSSSVNTGGVIATITFRGVSSGTAAVTFDFSLGSTADTNVAYQGQDRLASVTNASYTIDGSAPTAPSSLTATVSSPSQINLSWSASTDNIGVSNYQIERCSGSTSCSNFSQINTATGTSFNDTGLTAGTAYRYRVRATDAVGNVSSYSPIATATTTVSFDFTLGNAGNRTVIQGSSITNTITATLSSGTSQSTSFTVAGLPSGVTGTFSPTSCTPTCTTTLTMTATGSASVGTSTVTVTGTGGSVTKTSSFSLTVNLGTYTRTINTASLEGLTSRVVSGTLNVLNSSSTLIKAFAFTTNSTGNATISFDIPTQTAFLQIRAAPFLSRRISQDLNINTTYNFPQLLTGDINQDNIINSVDYSVLNTNWFTNSVTSDLNKDGLVNSIDYSYMNKNWLLSGE